jgi:hypothetical protein
VQSIVENNSVLLDALLFHKFILLIFADHKEDRDNDIDVYIQTFDEFKTNLNALIRLKNWGMVNKKFMPNKAKINDLLSPLNDLKVLIVLNRYDLIESNHRFENRKKDASTNTDEVKALNPQKENTESNYILEVNETEAPDNSVSTNIDQIVDNSNLDKMEEDLNAINEKSVFQ